MKRIVACVVVLVSVLVTPPARGQTHRTGWRNQDGTMSPNGVPKPVRVVESAGEVEVRFTSKDPGRIEYYTRNGDCGGYPSAEDPANQSALSPDECGRPFARASEDYVAVRGEWTFTEPGSRTVRIPIIDDDLDETDGEAFQIWAGAPDDLSTTDAVYETNGTYNLYIYIGDDDPKEDGAAPPPVAEQRPSGSSTVDALQPAPVPAPRAPLRTAVSSPPPDLEVVLPSAELEPGPGFELVIERDPEPASERDDRSEGSASWLALGLGATAVGSGGVVWLRRVRRWSPTRS